MKNYRVFCYSEQGTDLMKLENVIMVQATSQDAAEDKVFRDRRYDMVEAFELEETTKGRVTTARSRVEILPVSIIGNCKANVLY